MVTYWDANKKTRITVTTPAERLKKRRTAAQFANNKKQQLIMLQMELFLKANQLKSEAEQNYMTTPVDKWGDIDRAKNEMISLGKSTQDILSGITALNTDLSLLNRGLADNMENWNKFLTPMTTPKADSSEREPPSLFKTLSSGSSFYSRERGSLATSRASTSLAGTEESKEKQQLLLNVEQLGVSPSMNPEIFNKYFTHQTTNKASGLRSNYKKYSKEKLILSIENDLQKSRSG